MVQPSASTSSRGRRFLVLWSVGTIVLFIGIGWYTIGTAKKYRIEATERHNARIDPRGVEPGRTPFEEGLPPGAHPRKVTVGIYLEGIAAISILDSTWNPVLYVWFKWTDDAIDPGETFRIVEGEILSKEKLKESSAHGEHYALYLVKAQVTKYFDTSRFPADDHLLTIIC